MTLKTQLSFSTGELDPALHDNVTLEKFNKGLKTARNVIIGKTGSILSKQGRAHYLTAKNSDEPIRIVCPPNSGYLLEFGLDYVRVYDFSLGDAATAYQGEVDTSATPLSASTWSRALTEEELASVHYVVSQNYVYCFLRGLNTLKFDYENLNLVAFDTAFGFGIESRAVSSVTITRTLMTYNSDNSLGDAGDRVLESYDVEYAMSVVYDGEEYNIYEPTFTGDSPVLPVTSGEMMELSMTLSSNFSYTDDLSNIDEVKIYRRPADGGAYGYIGSTTVFTNPSGDLVGAEFIDYGVTADFTNNPPELITNVGMSGKSISETYGKTGAVYQQRLLLTDEDDLEAILASRPSYQNNFYRDYPYDADSALKFKSGTTGRAEVLRIVDSNGLVVFTTVGVYVNTGVLSIDNVTLTKVGNWLIDPDVPPLVLPDGVFFVDQTSNAIRQLVWSDSISTYTTIEHSIFSNHLFREKTIKSWAFQDGVAPLVTVVFTDGTLAHFTYHYEHQMKAWTRGDGQWPVEYVEGTGGVADTTFYVVNKDGQRHVEISLPRFATSSIIAENPEYDKLNFNFVLDGMTTFSTLLNDNLTTSERIQVVEIDDTSVEAQGLETGEGIYYYGVAAELASTIFSGYSVGDEFKWFDPNDNTGYELEMVYKSSDFYVWVKAYDSIDSEFRVDSSDYNGDDFRLYELLSSVTMPSHLYDEDITVIGDGYIQANPKNDVDGYDTVNEGVGTLTLPEKAAIVILGRPVVADIETLNITTLAQSPTTVEDLTVNKLYTRHYKSRGLYIGNELPDNDSVVGMEDMGRHYTNSDQEITGNKPIEPFTGRIESNINGSWDTQGQISFRQVDPYHFEIVSIIPDVEILNRSNK